MIIIAGGRIRFQFKRKKQLLQTSVPTIDGLPPQVEFPLAGSDPVQQSFLTSLLGRTQGSCVGVSNVSEVPEAPGRASLGSEACGGVVGGQGI